MGDCSVSVTNLSATTNLVKAVTALAALTAPVALIIKRVKLPDELESTALIVLPALGVIAIFLIMIASERIARINPNRFALGVALAAFLAAAMTGAYLLTARELVLDRSYSDGRDRALDLKPLSLSEPLQEKIGHCGKSVLRALTNCPEIRDQVRRESIGSFALLLVMMVCAQLLLEITIIGSAWWITLRDRIPREHSDNGH